MIQYPYIIRPLTKEDGGGYLITFPDLPGCMSDGETPEEAYTNGLDAMQCWLAVAKEHGDSIPEPSFHQDKPYSGKYLQRLPKSLHQKLAERAQEEGVSINMLASTLIAEGLGARQNS